MDKTPKKPYFMGFFGVFNSGLKLFQKNKK